MAWGHTFDLSANEKNEGVTPCVCVCCAEVKGPPLPPGSWPGSGLRFAAALGKRYVAIGTAYGGASLDEKTAPVDDSADAALAKVASKPLLLLLRESKRPNAVHAWLAAERPMRFQVKHLMVPLGAFDAVAFFPEAARRSPDPE